MPYKYNPFINNFDDSTTGPAGTVSAAGNGTALLPGIAFASYPNTGLWSPGASQLAITTGGVTRLYTGASGLEVYYSSAYLTSSAASSGVEAWIQNQTDVGGDNTRYSGLNFSIGSDTGTAAIRAFRTNSATNYETALTFWTKGNGAGPTTPSERVRIDSSGRLGVGTSSPSEALTVAGNIRVNNTNASIGLYSTSSSPQFILGNSAGTAHYIIYETVDPSGIRGSLNIYDAVAASSRVTVDTSGRVGIGLTGPTYQLQLSTDSAGKPSTNTWTIVSDERIKEDIELADLDLCYEAIKTIPLKRYKWRDDVYSEEQVTDRRKLGWIAQDVEAVFPKAVSIHEFKYNQVYETVTVPEILEELDDEGNVIKTAVPEYTKQELVSEETIPDCKDLNADQIYAAMYGAIQKLIIKFEAFEERLDAAGIK